MGSCIIDGPDGRHIQTEGQLIQMIKNSPTRSIIHYLHDHQKLHALKYYFQFLSKLDQLLKEGDQLNELEFEPHAPSTNSNFSDRLAYHSQEILKCVKQTYQSRKLIQQQFKAVKENWRQQEAKWKESLAQLLENTRKTIKSEIKINEDQSLSVEARCPTQQDQNSMKHQIKDRKDKIKSVFKQENEVEDREKGDVVATHVEAITAKYETYIASLKEQLTKITRSSNKALREQTENYKRKQASLQAEIVKLRLELENLGRELNDHKFESVETGRKDNPNLRNSVTKEEQSQSSISSTIMFKKFIDSKVIFTDYKEGKALKKMLDRIFEPWVIESSRLLFSFDKVRPNNMFEYVGNQNRNLILLARLRNGTVIGGFSRCGFKETIENMAGNYCFIFSIHPNGSYHKLNLKGECMAIHSVKLDRGFLKFGANEIRVTCGTNEGKSTLNTKACIFESKDCVTPVGLQQFLGMDTDTYEFQEYEIFELTIQPGHSENMRKIQMSTICLL